MSRLQCTLSAALFLLAASPAVAQTYNWNGANSFPGIDNDPTHWSNAYNWNPATFISPGTSVTLNFTAAPSGVAINDLGTFVLNSMIFNTGITVSGNA